MTEQVRPSRNMPLELRGGKFFRGKEPVPLEFGNLEQIRLINARIRKLKEMEDLGLVVDPNFTVTIEADISFKCKCEHWVYISAEPDDEDDYDCFDGKIGTCRGCQKKYEVKKHDDGELRVKEKINLPNH